MSSTVVDFWFGQAPDALLRFIDKEKQQQSQEGAVLRALQSDPADRDGRAASLAVAAMHAPWPLMQ